MRETKLKAYDLVPSVPWRFILSIKLMTILLASNHCLANIEIINSANSSIVVYQSASQQDDAITIDHVGDSLKQAYHSFQDLEKNSSQDNSFLRKLVLRSGKFLYYPIAIATMGLAGYFPTAFISSQLYDQILKANGFIPYYETKESIQFLQDALEQNQKKPFLTEDQQYKISLRISDYENSLKQVLVHQNNSSGLKSSIAARWIIGFLTGVLLHWEYGWSGHTLELKLRNFTRFVDWLSRKKRKKLLSHFEDQFFTILGMMKTFDYRTIEDDLEGFSNYTVDNVFVPITTSFQNINFKNHEKFWNNEMPIPKVELNYKSYSKEIRALFSLGVKYKNKYIYHPFFEYQSSKPGTYVPKKIDKEDIFKELPKAQEIEEEIEALRQFFHQRMIDRIEDFRKTVEKKTKFKVIGLKE